MFLSAGMPLSHHCPKGVPLPNALTMANPSPRPKMAIPSPNVHCPQSWASVGCPAASQKCKNRCMAAVHCTSPCASTAPRPAVHSMQNPRKLLRLPHAIASFFFVHNPQTFKLRNNHKLCSNVLVSPKCSTPRCSNFCPLICL